MTDIDVTPALICIEMDLPPIPVLPSGFSLDVPLPGIGHVFDVKLCCKIFQLPVGLLPPVSIGIAVPIPLIAALNAAITIVNDYARALSIRCPKE